MSESKEHEPDQERPQDDPGAGASESSPAKDKPPALPADDDSALGDTDQHSDA
ncbi:MAG TPA: hypothetical protein VIJ20_04070 [Solirubrobacteraceae bacterium]